MKETNENERNELEFGSFCVNIKEQDKVFQAYEKKRKKKKEQCISSPARTVLSEVGLLRIQLLIQGTSGSRLLRRQ